MTASRAGEPGGPQTTQGFAAAGIAQQRLSERVRRRFRSLHYPPPPNSSLFEVKGKKPIKMHFLNRLKPEFSDDPAGFKGNERLAELIRSRTPQ